MARRKAEVVAEIMEKAATAGPGEVIPLPEGVSLADLGSPVGLNDSYRVAMCDNIISHMAGLHLATDRAAINALAEAVADLARLMR